MLRDLSLMVKFGTFNLRNVGSNPIDLTSFYRKSFLFFYLFFSETAIG